MACVCASMALAGLAGGACGDDDSGASEGPPEYSSADESARTFAERLAKLIETTRVKKDCAQLDEINGRSWSRVPCPPSKALSRSMASFEVVGAKEYGTGAVIDYRSGTARKGATIVLLVGVDRRWGVARFGILTEPSTDTDDADSRRGFRAAAEDYLTAVRTRDCKAFAAVSFTGDTPDDAICEALLPATETLRRQLKADPSARLRYEGGNATYGFFSIETDKPAPANTTISLVKSAGGGAQPYLVLDIADSPTADQQEAVIKLLERSKTSPEPSQSPSQKVD